MGPSRGEAECARRSPGDASKDAGSIPAVSTPVREPRSGHRPGLSCVRAAVGTGAQETFREACDAGSVDTLIVWVAQYLLFGLALLAGLTWLALDRPGKVRLAAEALVGLAVLGVLIWLAAAAH